MWLLAAWISLRLVVLCDDIDSCLDKGDYEQGSECSSYGSREDEDEYFRPCFSV